MPATGPSLTVEQLNFFKLQLIVYDDFPEAMRLVFKTMWDKKFPAQPWDDSVAVHNQFSTQEARNPKKHMVPIRESYKTWHITALVHATIFAFSFQDPATGQTLYDKYLRGSAPPPGSLRHENISTGNQDETFALAVDQLRLLKNAISHAPSTKVIDKTTFHRYTYRAKMAFQAIGYSTKNIDDITNLPEDEFLAEKIPGLKERIKKQKNAARCKNYWLPFAVALVIVLLGICYKYYSHDE